MCRYLCSDWLATFSNRSQKIFRCTMQGRKLFLFSRLLEAVQKAFPATSATDLETKHQGPSKEMANAGYWSERNWEMRVTADFQTNQPRTAFVVGA